MSIAVVKNKIIDTLVPIVGDQKWVCLQGSLSPDSKMPNRFVTYFITNTDDQEHFDNKVRATRYYISVVFYSKDIADTVEYPETIIQAMRPAGFIPDGKGNDFTGTLPSYFCWAMDFIYSDTENILN